MTLTTSYAITFRLSDGDRQREFSITVFERSFTAPGRQPGLIARLERKLATVATMAGIITRSLAWGVLGV